MFTKCFRTFDVDSGNHPCQFILDTLEPTIYEAVQTWLGEIMPGFPTPGDFKFPNYSVSQRKNQRVLYGPLQGSVLQPVLPSLSSPEVGLGELVDVPLMALTFQEPVDGLPLFHAWLGTAKGIYMEGFELREIIEVQTVGDLGTLSDQPMTFNGITAVKGLGRVSVILFGVIWTYMNKDSLDAETQSDFCRQETQPFAKYQFGDKTPKVLKRVASST